MDAVVSPAKRLLSSDSHVLEPPNCYIDFIEAKWKDKAPKMVTLPDGGDIFVIDNWDEKIPIAILGQAGVPNDKLSIKARPWSQVPQGGWDSKKRLEAQDQDGVSGEVLYPSVGLVLCNHQDAEYKRACMWAYNRWLEGYASIDPQRLLAIGTIEVSSVDQAVADLKKLKSMGFRGVMLPGHPATEFDYQDLQFDKLWQASIELDMPISFHILTTRNKEDKMTGAVAEGVATRSKYASLMGIIRSNQDLVTMFILSGVFERNPELKFVCVESEAGWAAHQAYRLDRLYDRLFTMARYVKLSKKPSEFFRENIYLTFQDDIVAFQTAHLVNHKRLLWASDYPHTDSTWPNSRSILNWHASCVSQQVRDDICGNNLAELYKIK